MAAFALLAGVLAGCGSPEAHQVPGQATAYGLWGHNAAGELEVPPESANLAVRLLPLGEQGYEPTLGITSGGTLLVAGGEATVWRSADRGRTWTDVSDHLLREDQDPYLWLDPATDRVFSAPNQVACADVRWSVDGGLTWKPVLPLVRVPQPTPTGGCGGVGHDHQSLVAGPPVDPGSARGYPNTLYYTFNARSLQGTFLTRSFDGGASWEPVSRRVFEPDCQIGLNGAPAVGPDGTLYVPKPGCSGLLIAVSRDGGVMWQHHALEAAGMGGGTQAMPGLTTYSTNPAVAVDEEGNAFVLWAGEDGLLHLSHSEDRGVNWSAPVVATPPHVRVTAFSALTAGAEGRLAFAYVGASADPAAWAAREAHFAPAGTAWHLMVGLTLDGLAADPTFTTVQATPPEDPVQVGCIWQAGDAGPLTHCRNLRDFLSIVEHEGRAVVAFADGCRRCASQEDSTRADLTLAVVDAGPGLRGGRLAPYLSA
ncbi:MAG TPA: sialidase family protein [Candidatus Thermoplasmatota archaeon]|nr:sialidase family protein [Candidatus Thermoplasmatota archaeon]